MSVSSRRSSATEIVLAPVPHAGRRSDELGPRCADDEKRAAAAVPEQLLDDVEEQAVRPVHVLERDDHGSRLGQGADQARDAPRDIRRAGRPVQARGHRGRVLVARHEGCDAFRDRLAVGNRGPRHLEEGLERRRLGDGPALAGQDREPVAEPGQLCDEP